MYRRDIETQPNTRLRACAFAVATAFPAAGFAAAPVQVEFAVGNAQILNPAGQARAAQKGAEVGIGEKINTNAGRVQLRFSDGAYVSLQPGSEFIVDDYKYNGKADGSERGFFSLLKGGLRTITGVVGRSNRKNYQLTTTVATIGIRGTEYTVVYTNSITGSVGEGDIEVCNKGGCSGFANGESYLVPDPDTKPVLTEKKSDLAPTQPDAVAGGSFGDPGTVLVSGDDLNTAVLFTGTHAMNWYSVDQFGSVSGTFGSPADVVFNDDGSAKQLFFCPQCGPFELKGVTDVASNGIFTWGRGLSTSSSEMLHYIAGLPTPLVDINALKVAGSVMTYSLDAGSGTRPTVTLPTGDLTGALASGTATLRWGDPGALAVGAYGLLDVSLSGSIARTDINAAAPPQLSFSLNQTGMDVSQSGQFPFSLGGTCTVNGASGCSMRGTVGGPGAVGLGIVYHADVGLQNPVVGTAAFEAQ